MDIVDIIEKIVKPEQKLSDYDYSRDEKELDDYNTIMQFCIDKLSSKYEYGSKYCQEKSNGYKLAQKAKEILENLKFTLSDILDEDN